MRARLLLFLVSANLKFLQGPSARSTQLGVCSLNMLVVYRVPPGFEVPQISFYFSPDQFIE